MRVSPLVLGIEPGKAMRLISRALSYQEVSRAYADMVAFFESLPPEERERKLPSGEVFRPEKKMQHLMDVLLWLAVAGAEPPTLATAILHDSFEDYPERFSLEYLRERYGERTGREVEILSKPAMETISDKRERWFLRNEAYYDQLVAASKVPEERWALGVSCADKASNLNWSIYKIRMGVPPSVILGHPWTWDVNRCIKLGKLFDGVVPSGMKHDYRRVLAEFWSVCVTYDGLPDDRALIDLVFDYGLGRT